MNAARLGHTATLLPNGKVLVVGGKNTNYLASVEVYDPNTNIWTTVAPMNTARAYHTATLLPNGKVFVVGGATNVSLSFAEIYDPSANTWTNVASMKTPRKGHTATLLPDGRVLVAGGFNTGWLGSVEVYNPDTNNWTTLSSMNVARYSHTATLLPNGKVLLVGGNGGSDLTSTEVYDPTLNVWTTTASLNIAREAHTATLMPNGKVLVVGGYNYNGTNNVYLSSAEVYNPSLNTWTTVIPLSIARKSHTATLLPDGKVLVVGGSSNFYITSAEIYQASDTDSWTTVAPLNAGRFSHTATLLLSGKVLISGGGNTDTYGMNDLVSTEVYDPGTNTWKTVAPMNTPRSSHTATLLPDGKVLVIGGTYYNGPSSYLASAEIYDPNSDTWKTVAPMSTARVYHTATLLPSGKVLVAGGLGPGGVINSSVEIYDPSTNIWTIVAPLNTARVWPTATLLPNGKVLIVGGSNSNKLASAEIYDPNANTWTTVAPLNTARAYHTATLLLNGKVLVTGGYCDIGYGGYTASAEIYDPGTNTWTNIAAMRAVRSYHTATLLPGGKVLVAGSNSTITAEVFDPVANTWSNASQMNNARYNHQATLLPNGKILFTGGHSSQIYALGLNEVYNPGLGFNEAWRPTTQPISSPLTLGTTLSLTGSGYRGFQNTETSAGGTNNSATNVPVVQIRRLDSEQTQWIGATSFSATTYTSQPVTNIPAGPALVTVFVNGIPSVSQSVMIINATGLTLTAPDITYNANGIITITVFSPDAVPTGVVTLNVDSDAPRQQVLTPVTGGWPQESTATFTLSSPNAGMHVLNAAYLAQNSFAANFDTETFTVNKAATTTALGSSKNPSKYIESVTFTAVVTSNSGIPTGTVTFKDGATTLGTSPLASGTATYATSFLAVGTHAITAEYSGNVNFNSSTATLTGAQVINLGSSSLTLISNLNPSAFGQPVTFTATINATGLPTGSVTFKDGITTLGTRPIASGTATFSTSDLTVGTHAITAEYSGDTNFSTSAATLTGGQVVNPASTALSLSTSLNPSTFGQSVTFTAGVTSNAGTPTGSVTFKDGATILGTSPLASGTATFSTSDLIVGTHAITAEYSGDANFSTSAAALTGGQVVNLASTALGLRSSLNPSTFGQLVTFTATINSESGTPTGSVTFKDGSTTLSTNPLSSGTATFAASDLIVGTHIITAEYGGDTNHSSSTATLAGGQIVNPASTALALSSSLNPSTFSQSVTFTAGVTSNAGTPAGTVTFKDGATTLGTSPLASGTATFATSDLIVGTHIINAEYSGEANFSTSTANLTGGQVVNPASTTLTLRSSLNPSTFGQSVTFTTGVTSNTGTPTGTVTFKDGATTLGTSPLSSGTATFSTSDLAVGTHVITAEYSSDANFSISTATLTSGQMVNPASTTLSLSSSLNPSTFGQSVTFTAALTAGTGTPTGSVTFKDGTTTLGTSSLTSGTATFTTTSLAVGTHAITVEYGGDANFSPSIATLTGGQVVNPASTSLALTSNLNPSTFGQLVTFTATINSGSGTPTGTATFKDGATTLGTSPLTGGTATFATSALSVGTHVITADYSGDANFNPSTATLTGGQIVVYSGPSSSNTSILLSVAKNPAIVGQTVTLTAIVRSDAGTPTGTVTFIDGETVLAELQLTDGTVLFNTAILTPGSHAITAVYTGQTPYTGSTSNTLDLKILWYREFLPDILR